MERVRTTTVDDQSYPQEHTGTCHARDDACHKEASKILITLSKVRYCHHADDRRQGNANQRGGIGVIFGAREKEGGQPEGAGDDRRESDQLNHQRISTDITLSGYLNRVLEGSQNGDAHSSSIKSNGANAKSVTSLACAALMMYLGQAYSAAIFAAGHEAGEGCASSKLLIL
jgi:hypothetical protein